MKLLLSIILGSIALAKLFNANSEEKKESLTQTKKIKNNKRRKRLAHKVFFSFHFNNDVFRVQQIRNIGAIHGNMPVSPQDWEKAKNSIGGIEHWINTHMSDKDCVIVLVGSETHSRSWVQYEITKAWKEKKGLFGIHINDIKCLKQGTCNKGLNPFDQFTIDGFGTRLSSIIPCYTPPATDAYKHIANNIEDWVRLAIANASKR